MICRMFRVRGQEVECLRSFATQYGTATLEDFARVKLKANKEV